MKNIITCTREQEAYYRQCLKRERDRQADYARTKQGAFMNAIMSLDNMMGKFTDPSKVYAFSDNGEAVEAMIDYIDRDDTEVKRRRAIWRACNAIRHQKRRKELRLVLAEVLKNGNNREESIWEITQLRLRKLLRRRTKSTGEV